MNILERTNPLATVKKYLFHINLPQISHIILYTLSPIPESSYELRSIRGFNAALGSRFKVQNRKYKYTWTLENNHESVHSPLTQIKTVGGTKNMNFQNFILSISRSNL